MRITLRYLRNEYKAFYQDELSPREYAEYVDQEYFQSELLDEEISIIERGIQL